jgi:hypothetical protein
MTDQQKELTDTMWTDTSNLKIWQKDITYAIGSDWNKFLDQNQIPISLDKWEKKLAKKRMIEQKN